MPNASSDRIAITRAHQEALRAEDYAARLQRTPPDIPDVTSIEAIRAVEDANLMRFSALGELARDALRGTESRSDAFPKPVLDVLNKDGALKTLTDFRNNVLHATDGNFIGVSTNNVEIEQVLGQLRENLEVLKKNPELLRQLSKQQIDTLNDLAQYTKTMELHGIEDLKDPEKAKAILNDAASFHEARASCYAEEALRANGFNRSNAPINTNEYAEMRHSYHDPAQRPDHSQPRVPTLSETIDANAARLGGIDTKLPDYSQDSKIGKDSIAFGSDVEMDLRHATQTMLVKKIENIAKSHANVTVNVEKINEAMEGLTGDELKSLNNGISALNSNKSDAFKNFISELPEGQKEKVLMALTDIATGFEGGKWAEKLTDKIIKTASELGANGISQPLQEKLQGLASTVADAATTAGNDGLMQKALQLLDTIEGLMPEKLVTLGTKVGANIAFIGGTVAAAEMAFKTKEAMAAYQNGELNDKQLAACLGAYGAYVGQGVFDPTIIGGEEAIEAGLVAAGVPEKFRTGTLRQAVAAFIETGPIHIAKENGVSITNADMARETKLFLESLDHPERAGDPKEYQHAKMLYEDALAKTGDPEKARIFVESMKLQAITGLEPDFAFDFPKDFKNIEQPEKVQSRSASAESPAVSAMDRALASAKGISQSGVARYNPDGKTEADMVTVEYAAGIASKSVNIASV